MDYFNLRYGLFSDKPDLLNNAPFLIKMKERFPEYIKRAEKTQMESRKMARELILPRALEIDTKCANDPAYADWDLWREINRRKFTIGYIPEKMGGLGWSGLESFVFLEEAITACTGISAFFGFNFFGVVCALVEFKPEIFLKVIKDMVQSQKDEKPGFWAWSITEPSAGTDAEDAAAMATMKPSARAEKTSGGYILNGTKQFCSNGSLAHNLVITVCTDRARPLETMATFYVPSTAEGFSVGRVERKCGQKASQTAELILDNVFVPDSDVWEEPGRGLRHTREILSVTRGIIGMLGLGIARGALERCVQYTYHKKRNGRLLIEDNWIQMAIADMQKDIMALRTRCYDFAIALDTIHVLKLFENRPVRAALKIAPESIIMGESLYALAKSAPISRIAKKIKDGIVTEERMEHCASMGSGLKVAGTDLAMNVSSRVLDIVGLEGMAYRYGIEKSFRDAKGAQIYEGTNQANRLDLFHHEIAKEIGLC